MFIVIAALAGLVLIDGQPMSAALLVLGFYPRHRISQIRIQLYRVMAALFIARGEAGGLLSILILIAVLAVAVVPVAT